MSAPPELPRSIRKVDKCAERDRIALQRVSRSPTSPPLGSGSCFVGVDLADLITRDIPPPKFIVGEIIPARSVTLLGAHGGAGKSVLALALAAHVAAGVSWLGMGVRQGRAVFASLEDPASVVLHRLRRIVVAYGLPVADVVRNLVVIDGTSGDAALMREHVELGQRDLHELAGMTELREHSTGARLIVIDNASDAYDANENERRMVRRFVRTLAQLAREADAGVLLLAHVDKDAARNGSKGQTFSGSTAWHNSARSRLALIASAGGKVELHHEKSNLARTVAPIALHWSDRGVLMPSTVQQVDVVAAANAADASAVLDALRDAAARGVSVPTARTGPSTAHAVLLTLSALPSGLRGPGGRERFWAALSALECAGSVGVEAYRNTDRKLRNRFVIASICAPANSPIPPVELERRRPLSPPIGANSETGAESAQTGAPLDEVML